MNTTTAIESCPATVRQGSCAAAAKRPTRYFRARLSDAEVTALIQEIAALEAAAQRRDDARPS